MPTMTDTQQVQLFQTVDGNAQLQVALEHDTVWLTQAKMCELFGRERSVITKHINNLFKAGELAREAVSATFAHTEKRSTSEKSSAVAVQTKQKWLVSHA